MSRSIRHVWLEKFSVLLRKRRKKMKNLNLLILTAVWLSASLFISQIVEAQTKVKLTASEGAVIDLSDSSITIIWNRSTWETMLSDTVLTEDFESEPESYDILITPYLTTGGILIEGVLSPIKFQIQPPSNVDTLPPHSQRLHVRDFGQMMSFTFPDSMRIAAFGFDFLHRASELWELHVKDTSVTLQQVYAGFIGVLMKNYHR
jgi:hypothetical protein